MNVKIPSLALTPHGGGRVLVEIANKLVEDGNSVEIVTSNYPGSIPFELDQRVLIRKIGPKSSSKAVCVIFYLLLSPFYMRKSIILANHFLTVIPSWIAGFMSSRYIYLVQDIEYRFFINPIQWPLRILCRWTYQKGKIVAANAYLAMQLKNYNNILITLKLGISSVFFTEKNKNKVKIYDVVYFIRGQQHKRLDRFENLLNKFEKKNFKTLCISQDTDLLRKFTGRVTTCTPKNDLELIDAIDNAKVMLLTSEHEGFALPPLECMARGLPAVLYECGGPSIYAKNGINAYVIPISIDEETASNMVVENISALISDEQLYIEMSNNAKSTALDYRLDNAVNQFANFVSIYFKTEKK